MIIELPSAIAAYFAADKQGGGQAVSNCFTPDAVVIDEGNTYSGRDAIATLLANASTQYRYTVEPFALSHQNGRSVVTSHLVGNFPGSPVNLRYVFTLAGDRIARLEIVP